MLFWLTITALILFQVFGLRDTMQKSRDSLFERFQSERKSRVIALIHRQESQSVFGVQVSGHIDIEDSEAVLRAIRLTPDDQPIDFCTRRVAWCWRPSRLPARWQRTKARSRYSFPIRP